MRPNGSPPAHLCTLGCRGFKSPPIPCHVSSLSNGQKCSRRVKPLQLMVIACKRKRYRPQAARQIVARFPRLQRHAMFPNKQPEKECHGKTDSSMCLLSQIPTCSTPSQILHYPKLFSVSCYILLPSATGTLLGILTGDLENLSDGTPLLVKPHQAAFQSTRPADCESTHVQTANLWWHDLQRNDQKNLQFRAQPSILGGQQQLDQTNQAEKKKLTAEHVMLSPFSLFPPHLHFDAFWEPKPSSRAHCPICIATGLQPW